MRKKGKCTFYKAMIIRFFIVVVFFCFFCSMCSNVKHGKNLVHNMNSVKSIETSHIIAKYNSRSSIIDVIEVSNMQEAALYGSSTPISFVGQMTAYNPSCQGCTGRVYCPPSQDVRNGNIYFDDVTYGKIRILAADPAIPCGSIVKITNVSFSSDSIIGIVLDRGGAIKGNIMDFLVSESDDMDVIGRQKNVHYEIVRWGW